MHEGFCHGYLLPHEAFQSFHSPHSGHAPAASSAVCHWSVPGLGEAPAGPEGTALPSPGTRLPGLAAVGEAGSGQAECRWQGWPWPSALGDMENPGNRAEVWVCAGGTVPPFTDHLLCA